MAIIELSHGVWSFEEERVRSFLVVGETRALLIDTGWGAFDFSTEVPKLTSLPVALVNTHGDVDHISGNRAWQHRRFASRHELELLDIQTGGAVHTPVSNGHVFRLGGRALEVLETPGHTPGSICLLDRANGILFPGDTISLSTIYMFGPGRDLKAYIKSLRKLEALGSTVKAYYPSHGPCPLAPGDICGQLIRLAEYIEGGGTTEERAHLEFPRSSFDVSVFRSGDVSIYAP